MTAFARLLLAQLRTLGNLARHRAGRRALISAAVSVAFLALVSSMFGEVVAHADLVLDLRDPAAPAGAGELRPIVRALLLPAALLCAWFGFGAGRRLLFELPHTELLLCAPLAPAAILAATLVRFAFLATLWGVALCGPALRIAVAAAGAELGWGPIVLAVGGMTTVMLGTILAVQVVIQRWLSGRVGRALLDAASILTSTAFSLMLLAGALAREEGVDRLLGASRGRGLVGSVVGAPAEYLVERAAAMPAAVTPWIVAGWAAVGLALLLATAPIYRTAHAHSRRPDDPLTGGLLRRGRWPCRPAAAILRKELTQLLQSPTQLVGLLVSSVVIVVLAAARSPAELAPDGAMPEALADAFAMLGLWTFAQLAVAPSCLPRFTVADAAQWPLYVVAPVSRFALLRGKLYAVGLLQLWPAPIVAIVGVRTLDAEPAALLLFAAALPPTLLVAAASCAFVGTSPMLMRPDPDRSQVLSIVAMLVLMLVAWVAAVPLIALWVLLDGHYRGGGALAGIGEPALLWGGYAAVWLGGAALAALWLALAARHLERLTRPATR